MTETMFASVLDSARSKTDSDGWHTFPDGRLVTLYAAHNGASLTVAKIEAIRASGGALRARTQKGETFHLSLEDVFAIACDAGSTPTAGRKAGFLG